MSAAVVLLLVLLKLGQPGTGVVSFQSFYMDFLIFVALRSRLYQSATSYDIGGVCLSRTSAHITASVYPRNLLYGNRSKVVIFVGCET